MNSSLTYFSSSPVVQQKLDSSSPPPAGSSKGLAAWADSLSRNHSIHSEWSLSQSCFHKLTYHYNTSPDRSIHPFRQVEVTKIYRDLEAPFLTQQQRWLMLSQQTEQVDQHLPIPSPRIHSSLPSEAEHLLGQETLCVSFPPISSFASGFPQEFNPPPRQALKVLQICARPKHPGLRMLRLGSFAPSFFYP